VFPGDWDLEKNYSAGFNAKLGLSPGEDILGSGGSIYLVGGVKWADFTFDGAYDGMVVLPDGTTEGGSMLVMAVGNNRFAGGGYNVAPQASLTDGLLDVAVLSGSRPTSMNRIAAELRDPTNAENEHLLYRQLPKFTIESKKPLHVNLDGEPVQGLSFDFRCCPGALSVVLGEAGANG